MEGEEIVKSMIRNITSGSHEKGELHTITTDIVGEVQKPHPNEGNKREAAGMLKQKTPQLLNRLLRKPPMAS